MKCFVCHKSEKILNFSDETFDKCCFVLNIRRSKGFKYGDIILSSQSRILFGYHIECYRKFIALKSKYKDLDIVASEEFKDKVNNSVIVSINYLLTKLNFLKLIFFGTRFNQPYLKIRCNPQIMKI